MAGFHLAQVNVARLRAPIDHPDTQEFVDALEPINAVADAAPGFVWRLQTESGDATSIRAFDDDLVIVNLSVWATLEDLRSFMYRTDHAGFLRRRRTWFEPTDGPSVAMWWIPVGEVPTVEDAVQRLGRLEQAGPSPEAFDLRRSFPPDG